MSHSSYLGRVAEAALLTVASVVAGALACVALRTFVIDDYRVTSVSMEPTVREGALALGEKLSVREGGITAGEVVTLRSPEDGKVLLKRVAATGGQTVMNPSGATHVVAPGCVFVVGDNEALSHDSRAFGDVPASEVVSHVFLVLNPAGPAS